MDKAKLKAWLVPILVRLALAAGRYVIAPIIAITGAAQASVQAWYMTTVELAAACIVGALASYADKKYHEFTHTPPEP